jgi:hypothetical protein
MKQRRQTNDLRKHMDLWRARGVGAAADIFKSLSGSWVRQILPSGKILHALLFPPKQGSIL